MEKATKRPSKDSATGVAAADRTIVQKKVDQELQMPEPGLRSYLPQAHSQLSAEDSRRDRKPFSQTVKTGNIPDNIREKMERSYAADFSMVKVLQSSEIARNMRAVAVTKGDEIHVAPGYDPYSGEGQALLGHELSHVLQQRHGRVFTTHFEDGMAVNDSSNLEAEADKQGQMAARGEVIPFSNAVQMPTQAVQKKSSVMQMWRPLPGQARVESTDPDIDGAWRAVRWAISGAVNAWVGDIASEFRAALIGRISEELQGGLGTISLNNFKTYSGLNLTWRGSIQFMIDGIREIPGGGTGSTVIGSGGSTTTGLSVTGTETGGTTGGATVSSSPGSGGGTGGSANAGVSSGNSTARTDSASHTSSATSASTVNQVLNRYRASIACFVDLSAESSVGDSGWDYVNPFQWGVALGNAITGDAHGSASTNCGTVTYYVGSGISR